MPRWWIITVLACGCSHDMSDREYCTRRQMAWEMAFPNLTLSDGDRSRFVETCVGNAGRPERRGELERSIRCMNQHLEGHGHAREQFDAFTRCEGVDPSRER